MFYIPLTVFLVLTVGTVAKSTAPAAILVHQVGDFTCDSPKATLCYSVLYGLQHLSVSEKQWRYNNSSLHFLAQKNIVNNTISIAELTNLCLDRHLKLLLNEIYKNMYIKEVSMLLAIYKKKPTHSQSLFARKLSIHLNEEHPKNSK